MRSSAALPVAMVCFTATRTSLVLISNCGRVSTELKAPARGLKSCKWSELVIGCAEPLKASARMLMNKVFCQNILRQPTFGRATIKQQLGRARLSSARRCAGHLFFAQIFLD